MKTTLELTDDDIRRAIQEWLESQGYQLQCLSLQYDPGSGTPNDPGTGFSAKAQVETLKPKKG